jgi:hypothetical protein
MAYPLAAVFGRDGGFNIARAEGQRRRKAYRLALPEQLFDNTQRGFVAGRSARRRDQVAIDHDSLVFLDPTGRILILQGIHVDVEGRRLLVVEQAGLAQQKHALTGGLSHPLDHADVFPIGIETPHPARHHQDISTPSAAPGTQAGVYDVGGACVKPVQPVNGRTWAFDTPYDRPGAYVYDVKGWLEGSIIASASGGPQASGATFWTSERGPKGV